MADQESGDVVCTNIDCEDSATADLIPSCCLQDSYEEGGIVRCTQCDSIVEDLRLEEGEVSAFHALNDYFGFGEEDATAPEPMQLSEAWGVLRDLMVRFNIKLPTKEGPLDV